MNKLNFKYLFPNLFLFCICMNLTACSEKNSGGDNLQSGDEIISFEPDLNTLPQSSIGLDFIRRCKRLRRTSEYLLESTGSRSRKIYFYFLLAFPMV